MTLALIHLAEIDCLTYLNLFDKLHIPDAIWSETVEQNRVSKDKVLSLTGVQQHTLNPSDVSRFIKLNSLGNLHRGELECLYLCPQASVSTLLTDDLVVRKSAKQIGVTPVGSLGVIVGAYRLGNCSLKEAEQHITNLFLTSSLFVTRDIIDIALKQLRP